MSIKKLITMLAVFAAVLGTSMPARADIWLRSESPNFIVYSDENKEKLTAYVHKLEHFHYIASHLYIELGDSHFSPTEKHRFYLLKNVSSFKTVRPEVTDSAFNTFLSCHEGYQFFSTSSVAYNNMRSDGGEIVKGVNLDLAYMFLSLNRMLLVEYFSYNPPSWLKNGLNAFMMTADIESNSLTLGKPMPNFTTRHSKSGARYSITGKNYRVNFSDILSEAEIPDGKYGVPVQDWVITHHMMIDANRRSQLKLYLDLYASGVPSLEAFKTATGEEIDFDAIFDAYARDGAPAVTYNLPQLPPASIKIAPLPEYREPVPLLDAALFACPKADYGQQILSKLEKQSQITSNDPLTRSALMRAQILYGSPLSAQKYINDRLAENPDDYEARYWNGRMHLQLAQKSDDSQKSEQYTLARNELGKAYKLNPSSAPLLYYYARSHENRTDYPNENVLSAIRLAQDYSTGSYGSYYLEMLLRSGNKAEAIEWLEGLHRMFSQEEVRTRTTKIIQSIEQNAPIEEILALYNQW